MENLRSGAARLGINLTRAQLDKLEIYYKELIDWNRRINLTRITDYKEVQIKHFLDSLTLFAAIIPDGLKVIDIGTGAGFPGLPLKIVSPGFEMTLLEATRKKADFLNHLIGVLGLDGVKIVVGRAEEFAHKPEYREMFDLALARALAPLPVLAELALPFCKVGGYCIAPKKGNIEREIVLSLKAIEVMGGKLKEVKQVTLQELNEKRYLVIIDKVKVTPPDYARRPGIPSKKPILS